MNDVRPFPEPTGAAASRSEVLVRYLDYFRDTVLTKVQGLSEDQLRGSRLPSGWSPLELLHHLTHVERRWLVWGFEGQDVDDPWADWEDGRWHVPSGSTAAQVVGALREQGERTREVVARHDLDDVGVPGERWDGAPPATLERVLLHLLQEYARHAGHLDVVRELIDGSVGE
ncbi:MAG: DinB family protein [Motilibacteraceae bacterium]